MGKGMGMNGGGWAAQSAKEAARAMKKAPPMPGRMKAIIGVAAAAHALAIGALATYGAMKKDKKVDDSPSPTGQGVKDLQKHSLMERHIEHEQNASSGLHGSQNPTVRQAMYEGRMAKRGQAKMPKGYMA